MHVNDGDRTSFTLSLGRNRFGLGLGSSVRKEAGHVPADRAIRVADMRVVFNGSGRKLNLEIESVAEGRG